MDAIPAETPTATPAAEKNLVDKVRAWLDGELDKAVLTQAIEEAADIANTHRTGFGEVVETLNEDQQDRCGDLIAYAFGLLDALERELELLLEGLETEDRERVITSADMIARATFQLNQCFGEFRNQALAALGPTDIPSFNQLVSVKEQYLTNPDEQTQRNFQESIDVERIIARDSVRTLSLEPQIPEVISLTNAFQRHLELLNRLTTDLANAGLEADYPAHYVALEMSFRDLNDLVPMVNVALRAKGETEFPDLNYFLTMLKDKESGGSGDGPFVEALQLMEASFLETYQELEKALPTMETALAQEEVQGALNSFEDLKQGVEAAYRFLAERELIRLSQARGFLLDFATRLSGHRERLKELEEMEGKITCPRCSEVNEPDRQRCVNCGFALPQNVGSTTTTTFQTREAGGLDEAQEELLLTSNLVRLYESVNAVHEGRIDDTAFLTEIERFETLVNASVRGLPAEPAQGDPKQNEAVNQVYDAFEEGVEFFRQGTELFRSFLDSRDAEALKSGVIAIDQGAKRLEAARKALAPPVS